MPLPQSKSERALAEPSSPFPAPGRSRPRRPSHPGSALLDGDPGPATGRRILEDREDDGREAVRDGRFPVAIGGSAMPEEGSNPDTRINDPSTSPCHPPCHLVPPQQPVSAGINRILGRGAKSSQTALPSGKPLARARGAYRNRTGVNGFAGRCVATPPRRRRPGSVAGGRSPPARPGVAAVRSSRGHPETHDRGDAHDR